MSAYDSWKCTPPDYWEDDEPEMVCDPCNVFMDLKGDEFTCPECCRVVSVRGDEREPAEVCWDDDGEIDEARKALAKARGEGGGDK